MVQVGMYKYIEIGSRQLVELEMKVLVSSCSQNNSATGCPGISLVLFGWIWLVNPSKRHLEFWSSGQGRKLINKRLWVRISPNYKRIFSPSNCSKKSCIICLKKIFNENKIFISFSTMTGLSMERRPDYWSFNGLE